MRVVMFGLGQLSSLAWYCLTHDSPHEIVAFTVDGAYRATSAGVARWSYSSLI